MPPVEAGNGGGRAQRRSRPYSAAFIVVATVMTGLGRPELLTGLARLSITSRPRAVDRRGWTYQNAPSPTGPPVKRV